MSLMFVTDEHLLKPDSGATAMLKRVDKRLSAKYHPKNRNWVIYLDGKYLTQSITDKKIDIGHVKKLLYIVVNQRQDDEREKASEILKRNRKYLDGEMEYAGRSVAKDMVNVSEGRKISSGGVPLTGKGWDGRM